MNIFVVLVALVCMIIEIKAPMCRIFIRRTIESHIGMLRTVEGRGYFYLFCSTMCLCQWSRNFSQILNIITGCFMVGNGAINIAVGMMGRWSLEEARAKFVVTNPDGTPLTADQLERRIDQAFDEADKDFSGDLDHDEMLWLMKNHFAELREAELESVLMILDQDGDGRISRRELKAWYLGQDPNATPAEEPEEEEGLAADLTRTYAVMLESPTALSIFASLAGLGLMIGGATGGLDGFFNWFEEDTRETAFAEVFCCGYAFVIGLFAVVLENPQVKLFHHIKARVEDGIGMLRFLWGRGILYLIGSLLLLIQTGVDSRGKDEMETMFAVLGVFMLLVSIVSLYIGFTLLSQMNALKDEIESEAHLDEKWHACNPDGNGELDSKEFPKFLQSISGPDSPPLSYNELCATIQELDADNNGKISLEEFKIWWRRRIVVLPSLIQKAVDGDLEKISGASKQKKEDDITKK